MVIKQSLRLVPIHKDWVIQVESTKEEEALESSILKAIDDCWNQLKAEGKTLFDGWIFSLTYLDPPIAQGHFIPYRHYAAWYHRPQLRFFLPIRPLCVTGVTYTNSGKVLVGKRSSSMMQFPNCYELPPSGGVDLASQQDRTINYKQLVQRELLEETGISEEFIEKIELFAALFDDQEGTMDLCLKIKIKEKTPFLTHSEEYQELALFSKKEIHELLMDPSFKVLPSFKVIWEAFL